MIMAHAHQSPSLCRNNIGTTARCSKHPKCFRLRHTRIACHTIGKIAIGLHLSTLTSSSALRMGVPYRNSFEICPPRPMRWRCIGLFMGRMGSEKTNASVRERFLTPVDTYPNLPQTKCIVRPERISGMFPHWPIDIHEPVRVVNTHGEPVNWCMSEKITKDIAVVDHYFTRSLEEWNEKIARGSCDPQYMRPDAMFYIINPDMRDSE